MISGTLSRRSFSSGGGIGARGCLAARAAMPRQAIVAARGLDHARMRRHEPRPPVDFNLIFGLAHFDVTSNEVVGEAGFGPSRTIRLWRSLTS